MLRRNTPCITSQEKGLIVPLYKVIVIPHLIYSIHTCRPYCRKGIGILNRIQRRTTKLITGLRYFRYEERLKECGLTTLGTQRCGEGGGQIEVCKTSCCVYSLTRVDLDCDYLHTPCIYIYIYIYVILYTRSIRSTAKLDNWKQQ